MTRRRLFHLEDLLGRRVARDDGAYVGRIEEVRAERRGDDYEISEYLLGTGALVERLSLTRRLLRRRTKTYIARWDQLDVSRPDRPRLTCSVDELKVQS